MLKWKALRSYLVIYVTFYYYIFSVNFLALNKNESVLNKETNKQIKENFFNDYLQKKNISFNNNTSFLNINNEKNNSNIFNIPKLNSGTSKDSLNGFWLNNLNKSDVRNSSSENSGSDD